MPIGLKGNNDGSGAIQIGGSDAIAISTGLNTTFAGTVTAPTGTLYPIVSGTAVASTTGTAIDFTNIPAWVKRITVMLNGVSLSGTANLWVQAGSGSITSSGYVGNRAYILNTTVQGNGGFTSALIEVPRNTAASATTGHVTITNVSGNVWVASMVSAEASVFASFASGTISLSGVLDRIRIIAANGTDTFDAGTVNILYE